MHGIATNIENTALFSVSLENNVTSIGMSLFRNCSRLTSVTIGNGLVSISESAFSDCTGLTSINIPNSVISIDPAAFYNCTELRSVTIGNSVTTIDKQAFYGCTSLKSISIPGSITSIGQEAFKTCSGLTNVILGNNVTSIGGGAFHSTALTTVTIPNSVTSIGDHAFRECAGLADVTIGTSINSIGLWAFIYCPRLTHVNFMGDVPAIVAGGVFESSPNVTVYYLPGTLGWGSSFADRPTAPSTPPSITGAAVATATVGQPFNFTIVANDSRIAFAATGLPIGLTLDTTTGVISGIPTAQGTYPVNVSASNPAGTGNQILTLTILPEPILIITSPSIATATIGLLFNYAITANSPPGLFNASALPQGLACNKTTGVISGIPTTEGIYSIILSAGNANGLDSRILTLTVIQPTPQLLKINFIIARNEVVLKLQDGGVKEHIVEYTDDFKQWSPLANKLIGAKELFQLDPNAKTHPFRFYRVVQR